MSWKTKLENIRANHHKRDEEATDVRIDYWELTWDKLLVKSEKLGSGAFGQVLRGKIIGKPPCYENFYENLQVRNLSQMENTDVAIKMLPKYADEAAKVSCSSHFRKSWNPNFSERIYEWNWAGLSLPNPWKELSNVKEIYLDEAHRLSRQHREHVGLRNGGTSHVFGVGILSLPRSATICEGQKSGSFNCMFFLN